MFCCLCSSCMYLESHMVQNRKWEFELFGCSTSFICIYFRYSVGCNDPVSAFELENTVF